ncbi:MAG: hypothetical protein Q9191_006948 [Dirinaria sp. TL-2023a]
MASTDEPRIEADPDIQVHRVIDEQHRELPLREWTPISCSELDRLDLTHGMIRLTMNGKLFFAPIGDKPGRILDVGTGTGIWAIDVGDEYPNTEIIGTDISPTQPSWVPANVKFEIDDCEQPWTFEKPFDFVHARYMAATVIDWQKFVDQAFKFTNPGGWSEFQDFDIDYYSEDDTLKEGVAMSKWITTLLQAIADFGRDPNPGHKIPDMMEKAGYTGIVAQKFRIPIGPWPKDPHLVCLVLV